MQRTNSFSAQGISDLSMEQPNARCFSIVCCTSSVAHSPSYVRKSTAPLKMTQRKRTVSQPSSSIRPSSGLWIRQARASDVRASTAAITSPAAPLQP
eukprot:6010952-Pyramimonas_sp.AAC.1